MELYGIVPTITNTRLSVTANIGDTTVYVKGDVSEWKAGDELAFGASLRSGLGFEKHSIVSVVYNSSTDSSEIVLDSTIENWHYGNNVITVGTTNDSEVKVNGKYGGTIDMRCAVGHLTRNIKIYGTSEAALGGHLQVYHYIVDDDSIGLHINARGAVYL